MSGGSRSGPVVYLGCTILFAFLAWLGRLNLILGLAATPVLFHLLAAGQAGRVAVARSGAGSPAYYWLIAGRELLASALFAAGAGYIAVRMAGRPRIFWVEVLVAVMLVGYTLLAKVTARRTGPG